MFDLALGEVDDMPAAQRAIGLASSPVVMMERLIEHLLENFEFAEALRWYEELAQAVPRGHVRDGHLAKMQELALSKVQDLSAAERAIQLADDKQPLIEALIVYLRENQERDPALDWMQELARSIQDSTSRRPLLTDLVDYALLTPPRFSTVEDAIELADRPAPLIAKYIDALALAGEHEAVLDWVLKLAELSTLEQERETCFGRAVRVALHDLERSDLAEDLIGRSNEPSPLIEELVSWYMERGDYQKALGWT